MFESCRLQSARFYTKKKTICRLKNFLLFSRPKIVISENLFVQTGLYPAAPTNHHPSLQIGIVEVASQPSLQISDL